MNNATYKLANMNVQVTLTPKARAWAALNYVSLETCAIEAAQKHKARQPQFHAGIVVAEMEPPCMTAEDRTPGRSKPPRAERRRPRPKVAAAPPASDKGELYEPVGTMPVVGDRVAHVLQDSPDSLAPDFTPTEVLELVVDDNDCQQAFAGDALWDFYDFESGVYRILKRPARAAARVKVYRSHAYDEVVVCRIDRSRHWWRQGTDWTAHGDTYSHEEITSYGWLEVTGHEAEAILRDPELVKIMESGR